MVDSQNYERYLILYHIKGKANAYHKRLAGKIASAFGIPDISESIEPHITLKYFRDPLDNKQLGEIESLLERVCRSNRKAELKLEGIGHFDDRVIFIDVKPSAEMRMLYNNLTKELEKLSWVQWAHYEKENIHFHSTLEKGDIQRKFDEMYRFASQEKPDFVLEVNAISIFKLQKDKWVLYKEFKLAS